MRKLLILLLIAGTSAALSAQNTQRSGSKSSPPTRTTTTKTRTELTPKAGLDASAKSRTETPNTPTQRTTTRPAQAPGTTTPKTVPSQMPDAPQLKQDDPAVEIEWMTIEEALERSKTEKRKIFIDVFTEWCGWCKRMDQSTFVDPSVAQYLNENYYPVKFDAEQQDEISFNNKTYRFRKNGARGYHELAAELLNNRLSFPTVVFLDENMHVIQPIPGYLEAQKLETILNYFGTDSHKTTPWETYERKFSENQR